MNSSAIHRALVYPLGHPVEFESDAAEGIEAVIESWGACPQLFDSPALRFCFELRESGAAAGEPNFNEYGGTIQLHRDSENQGSFALRTRSGWLRVSRATFAERDWFRYHWLEALVLTALDTAFFTPVHAACISRDVGQGGNLGPVVNPPARGRLTIGRRLTTCPTSGVLLCGDSGTGKTTLAFAAARSGWTLVSDDGVHLAPDRAITAAGGAHTFRLREPARELFPELESLPTSIARNGKTAITVEAGAAGISTAWSTFIKHSVFLARRPGPANLRELSAEEGMPYFLEWVRNPDRSAAQIRLRELLARGCWRLEYEEFADALRLLDQLR